MIIDCISDLHGFYPELEGGDLLIVAGDLTANDHFDQYCEILHHISKAPYKKRILIGGNHDNLLQEHADFFDLSINFDYLQDSGTQFGGLKIWGSPWTTTFEGMNPHCKAFTVDTEEELAEKWELIPQDTDILITHEAPYGIGDYIPSKEEHVGSESLIVKRSKMPSNKLHVFGHIHEGYGITAGKFVNASHVNELYKPVNKPIRIKL